MLKDATPRQLAFWASLCITAFFAFTLFCISKIYIIQYNNFLLFNVLICFLLAAYMVVYYVIQNYLYRKVTILYKTIHKYKSTPDALRKMDSDTIFDVVETDVIKFVVDSQSQIESLKALEEYRRNYVGNVSHELKTPIFNIQGFLETLLDEGFDDPVFAEKYVTRAAKNAERLSIIVEDLETIDKLENRRIVLDVEPFDIKELVEEVFEDMEMQAAEKKIILEFKEPFRRKFNVSADKESIRRVLINLVANSIKYGQTNGRTRIGIYDMDKHILVEVADNGIGIEEQHLAHLFDRFYRVDTARSRDEGGSGLGLSIVKHIVEAHQQTINVRSTPKIGATFAFSLEKV